MDRAEAIYWIENLTGSWEGRYREAIDMAIAALREQEQREQNEPLTLEDLRKMNGEPVWIADGGFWALVRVEHNVKLIANDHETANAEGWLKHIGAIYRYKPGGADNG